MGLEPHNFGLEVRNEIQLRPDFRLAGHIRGREAENRGATGFRFGFRIPLLWARVPSIETVWFGPAPIARVFRIDSGIRLRRT